MAPHETFRLKTLDELREKIETLGLSIPLSEDLSPLHNQVAVGNHKAPNAFAVIPMEGCDSMPDGSPSPLVERRYLRFSAGGAGLLWWEACAVVSEGRANPLQMMLTRDNANAFAALLQQAGKAARDANGSDHRPVNILQLTHSGRYSRPQGHQAGAIIAQHDPILDPRVGVSPQDSVVEDSYLEGLVERYVESARLAREIGFDGVDIKACHRYLLSELLCAHHREGPYGGSFENRTRLLLDIVREIRQATGPDFIVASRFNAYDAHPEGFGCDLKDMWRFDPQEPTALAQRLTKAGAQLMSASAGNPYYIHAQISRPFDRNSLGIPIPNEHPLESVDRLLGITRTIQKAAGSVPVVGYAYTWLRQFLPYVAAGSLKAGDCSFVGLGRSSFAYPDAPRDVLSGKGMDPKKCCISCSNCTQIMRDHGRTGCVVRDAEIYGPLYREARADAEARARQTQLQVEGTNQ